MGGYYGRVHDWALAFLRTAPRRHGGKPLEAQLLDLTHYSVTHVARCLSDVALKVASGAAVNDQAAIFWTQLKRGGTDRKTAWHPSATANLQAHAESIKAVLNPEPPRKALPDEPVSVQDLVGAAVLRPKPEGQAERLREEAREELRRLKGGEA